MLTAFVHAWLTTITMGNAGRILSVLAEASEEFEREKSAEPLPSEPAFAAHDAEGKKVRLTKEQKKAVREYRKQLRSAKHAGRTILTGMGVVAAMLVVFVAYAWWDIHWGNNLKHMVSFSDPVVMEAVDADGNAIDGYVIVSGTVTNGSDQPASLMFDVCKEGDKSMKLAPIGGGGQGMGRFGDESLEAFWLAAGEEREFSYLMMETDFEVSEGSDIEFTLTNANIISNRMFDDGSVTARPDDFTVRWGSVYRGRDGFYCIDGSITNNTESVVDVSPAVVPYDAKGRPICMAYPDSTGYYCPYFYLTGDDAGDSDIDWIEDLDPGETKAFSINLDKWGDFASIGVNEEEALLSSWYLDEGRTYCKLVE